MATTVDVWAPAFAPYLDSVTVESSQAMFERGAWCRLCETHLDGDRREHAREHDRELKTWRAEQKRALTKRQREQLALIRRERKLTARVLAA